MRGKERLTDLKLNLIIVLSGSDVEKIKDFYDN